MTFWSMECDQMEIILALALVVVIAYHLLSRNKTAVPPPPPEEEKTLSPRMMVQIENFLAYDGTSTGQKDIEEAESNG